MGYSPWGLKELDTTERLHFHFPIILLSIIFQKCSLWGREKTFLYPYRLSGWSELSERERDQQEKIKFNYLCSEAP